MSAARAGCLFSTTLGLAACPSPAPGLRANPNNTVKGTASDTPKDKAFEHTFDIDKRGLWRTMPPLGMLCGMNPTTHDLTSTDLDALEYLRREADARGVTVMNLLSDLALADSSFRVVAGRTVVSREGGMPALCDACNELLRVKPHAEKIIRDEILRLCSIPSHEAGHTLASALILVGRRKRAREVLELFPIVQAVVRRT